MQRTWIWQPYHHADNTVADRQSLRPDAGERADDDVAQSLARKMMAWRERGEQARSPQYLLGLPINRQRQAMR